MFDLGLRAVAVRHSSRGLAVAQRVLNFPIDFVDPRRLSPREDNLQYRPEQLLIEDRLGHVAASYERALRGPRPHFVTAWAGCDVPRPANTARLAPVPCPVAT